MTPDFALSLSLAGIDLLQRNDDGWRHVGTASLGASDIAAALADLRATGQALAPEGFFTKLLIPMEQVKYLALDTAQTSLADITAALDGATPYALDALAIDFERSNGRTHIAAVAQETLREAEDFAAAHGFNPVAFVAVPSPGTFAQEIFFGPTTMAARALGPGIIVTRDSQPVQLPGTQAKTHPAQADRPAPALRVDRIIGEYHPPRQSAPLVPVVPVPVMPVPARIVLSNIPPAAPRHLDRIIRHYDAPAIQTEVPLIAVAAPGSTRPVVLGGVMAAVSQARLRRPAYALPGAIAASLAALGLIWWLQSGPAPVDAPLPVTELAQAAPPTSAQLDIAITPPDPGRDQPLAAQRLPDSETAFAASPPPGPLTPDVADSPDLVPQISSAPATGRVLTPDEAQAVYAATGVWQRPPRFVDLPSAVTTADVIWPDTPPAAAPLAAPRLPTSAALATDLAFVPLAIPPAADTLFDLDAEGFVRATPEGALTPEGAVVYAGLPDLPFRARPARPVDPATTSAEVEITVIPGPPPVVPPLRPATLDQTTPGGVSLAGLQPGASGATAVDDLTPPPGAIRPRARPALPDVANSASEIEAVLGGIALAAPDMRATGSAFAVATSLRPTRRPANFDRVVAAARSSQRPAATPTPGAIAAAPAPQQVQAAAPVAPQNYEPVPGGVTRAATQDSAIRLREINLIGVYGQPSARRALVRLSNGQFVRVQVGSELDGGQVTAIGENALNYVKRGTTYALQIPQG
jgi:hypothetical protein